VGARAKHCVEETIEDPRKQEHWKHDQRCQNKAETAEKEPALQRMLSGLVDTADKQCVVAAVGAPGDVEHVTEYGNGADDNFDRDVGDHARDCDVRDAAHPGCDDDDAGGDATNQIADAGDEADDAVQAEADGGAGNFDEVIQHMRQEIEVFVVESLASAFQAGRQDLGFRGKRHRTLTVSREIARRAPVL